MQYLSIDIETTGLDPEKHDMLEMVAVLEDTTKTVEIEHLPLFRALAVKDTYNVDPYCAQLHSDSLWKELMRAQKRVKDFPIIEGCSVSEDNKTFYCSDNSIIPSFLSWLKQHGIPGSITPAGKNFGAFDLQFLLRYAKMAGVRLPFKRRSIDPAILFCTPSDDALPDLPTCLSRAGLSATALHTAWGDAWDIIRLLRYARFG